MCADKKKKKKDRTRAMMKRVELAKVSSSECGPHLDLKPDGPDLVVRNGERVKFCTPADKEGFICFDNPKFFGAKNVSIDRDACVELVVRDDRRPLKYRYWLDDSVLGFVCDKDVMAMEQGDSNGGGELSGGS